MPKPIEASQRRKEEKKSQVTQLRVEAKLSTKKKPIESVLLGKEINNNFNFFFLL